MEKLYDYHADSIRWGFTKKSHVIHDFDISTRVYEPLREQRQCNPIIRSRIQMDPWVVYKCRTCNFLTHAIIKGDTARENEMAIVTNIMVSGREVRIHLELARRNAAV